ALEIVLPPGRVVSALKPAAMRMWMTYPMTIIDTIFKALAPAIPEHIIAGHHANLVVGRVNGRRPKDDSFYIYLGGLIGRRWGAKHDSDGCNATIAMNDGDTHNGPSEQVEAKYPLLVERYALRPDSGGAGRFRGGLGCEQVVQARHDLRFNSQMDRVKCKPWGLEGGLCGAGNSVAIHRFAAAQEQRFHNGKAADTFDAQPISVLRARLAGAFWRYFCKNVTTLKRSPRGFTASYFCSMQGAAEACMQPSPVWSKTVPPISSVLAAKHATRSCARKRNLDPAICPCIARFANSRSPRWMAKIS